MTIVGISVGHMRQFTLLTSLALLLGSTSAFAQSLSPGEAAVLECRALTNPAQQLACFRKGSDVLAAERSGSAAPKDEAAAPPPAAKRPFGAPALRLARKPKVQSEDRGSLKVKVLSYADRGDGRVIFSFDDGSRWVQTENDQSVAGSLKAGDSATLRHGIFSGYILDIPGRAFIRVARLGAD